MNWTQWILMAIAGIAVVVINIALFALSVAVIAYAVKWVMGGAG